MPSDPIFRLPRSWWMSLVFGVLFSTACTVSDRAECRSDDDCGAGEACISSGGVVVRDGICMPEHFLVDAGLPGDTGELDVHVPDDTGDPIDDTGDPIDDAGDLDTGPDSGGDDTGDEDTGDVGEPDVPEECPPTQALCSGQCVDTEMDSHHCGECDMPCAGDETCQDGQCLPLDCGGSEIACASQCVDPTTNVDHCGDCANDCTSSVDGGIPICDTGQCSISCEDSSETYCDDHHVCADLDQDDDHCGDCGEGCPSNRTCDGGDCVCISGLIECGGECIDPQSSFDHCGECNDACSSIEVCSGGECSDDCSDGLDACDGGCHDLSQSTTHCQSCDNACDEDFTGASPQCTEQGCQYVCNDGDQILCEDAGLCADLTTDDDHCGTCGNGCTTSIPGAQAFCEESSCQASCTNSSETLCEDQGVCADLETDDDHCGGCGQSCDTTVSGATASCQGGDCIVECTLSGTTYCEVEEVCANFETDDDHCGSCGNDCGVGQFCFEGACVDDTACLEGSAPFGGGAGTSSNPYRICSVDHFLAIGQSTAFLSDNFRLEADLDFAGQELNALGSATQRFQGLFDGNDHQLSNFALTGGTNLGLFSTIGETGEVRDLTLLDLVVDGGGRTGTLAGRNMGVITNVILLSGEVTGGARTGGLVGDNRSGGEVIASASHATVSGAGQVGGVVGENQNSATIEDVTSTAIVSSTHAYAGGIVGQNNGLVHASNSSAQVDNSSTYAGGIAGINTGTITDASSEADVQGDQAYVGGIVGMNAEGDIIDCSASGTVLGRNDWIGGIAGLNSGLIEECSSSAGIKGEDGSSGVGGIAGLNSATITNSHSTSEVFAEGNNVGGVAGNNTGDILNTFAENIIVEGLGSRVGGLVGYSTNTVEECGVEGGEVIGLSEVGGLIGRAEGLITGVSADTDVTADGLWAGGLIGYLRDAGGTNEVSDCSASGSVTGTNFTGGLIGYVVAGVVEKCSSSVSVSATDVVGGLVGVNDGTLEDVHASGTVMASQNFAGGLVGQNEGTIRRASASGSVSAVSVAGGLVGTNNALITRSFATGNVSVTVSNAGGLAGQNSGEINNCYAGGDATGNSGIGGLVGLGFDGGEIDRSHSYGSPTAGSGSAGGLVAALISGATVSRSYWDSQTSGTTSSAGGSDLLTTHFGSSSSFPDWDFSTIWRIDDADDGNSRPVLRWQ